MAVEGCHNSRSGNTGSPMVNGLSKRCFHVFWHSAVIDHNLTLTFLFVTVIFLMAVFEIPCEMWMLICFSGQSMGLGVSSGPKFQFPCGDRSRMNLFNCGPWETHHRCDSPPRLKRCFSFAGRGCTRVHVIVGARPGPCSNLGGDRFS